MAEFFQTIMGQRYYEHTLPELLRQMKRLNDNAERYLNHVAPALTETEKAILVEALVEKGEMLQTKGDAEGFVTLVAKLRVDVRTDTVEKTWHLGK